MHRNDTSNFLLYIEPKKEEKLTHPVDDELTKLMEMAFSFAERGCANYSNSIYPDWLIEKFGDNVEMFRHGGYMGDHDTDCGESSDNHDYRLQNGMIVNSLCVFYVRWYRNSIHENDWNKLKRLGEYYNIDITLPEVFPYSPPSTRKDTRSAVEKVKDIMVDELSKVISKDILEKIKDGKF